MKIPGLVAHRGYMQAYPENTLTSVEAALEVGGRYVEFDVHLSKDLVPVVIHDADLIRTTGDPRSVFDLSAKQLTAINAGYPERFGGQFSQTMIPILEQMMQLVARWPNAKAFVELKRRSLRHYGRELMLQQVLEVLKPYREQMILISYDLPVLMLAREQGVTKIGWVIETWGEDVEQQARDLAPDYLFGDYSEIPTEMEQLWPGPWQWVLFDVVDADEALKLAARGAAMIETKAIKEMLNHPKFSGQ